MKRLILFTLLIITVITGAMAQNRSINFEQTKEWKKVLKKAKKEKKLVFVDCYTSWCGPCKMLAKNVFTNDEVADFFNTHFVNVKFDMEKDTDGVMLKKQFDVHFFPTLVFVDPVSGEVLHRLVGAGKPDWLIAGAKLAMDPDNNLRNLMKRYENGERGAVFIRNYAEALFSAYSRDEAARVACEYLDVLPVDSLIVPENWEMIRLVVSNPLSSVLKRIMAEREKFYAVIGQKEVDAKLEKVIYSAVKKIAEWKPKKNNVFDEKGNQELIDYLMGIDFYAAPGGLAYLYTAACVRKNDFQGMLSKMDEALRYNLFRNGAEFPYFRDNMRLLGKSGDKMLMEEGVRRIDCFMHQCKNPLDKSNLMRVKAFLQQKLGDQAGAEVSNKEVEKYFQEARRKNKDNNNQ
ncbi:MAG TPA: thioredoxin family protein [Candidatus Butyricimonas faecavium]|nr:thioredoxin family protein [Candidatus Butyricimonas faecavium]